MNLFRFIIDFIIAVFFVLFLNYYFFKMGIEQGLERMPKSVEQDIQVRESWREKLGRMYKSNAITSEQYKELYDILYSKAFLDWRNYFLFNFIKFDVFGYYNENKAFVKFKKKLKEFNLNFFE